MKGPKIYLMAVLNGAAFADNIAISSNLFPPWGSVINWEYHLSRFFWCKWVVDCFFWGSHLPWLFNCYNVASFSIWHKFSTVFQVPPSHYNVPCDCCTSLIQPTRTKLPTTLPLATKPLSQNLIYRKSKNKDYYI